MMATTSGVPAGQRLQRRRQLVSASVELTECQCPELVDQGRAVRAALR